ncbi:hypothetical protein ITJ38_10100 [Agreia pratensis]|uniref:hypothetical protein n=1 Tax=Agreia pratensis TaxID=150121 RepID=UPI00188D7037|nr:hypothetical protein [Agreia pratensis]MBF4634752.1 hypothetical protein [Agreia pratensis]
MTAPLVVAIVAAVASLLAAGFAFRSARDARASANRINSRNHRVAALDRDASELREAFKEVLEATTTPQSGHTWWAIKVISATEILPSCRASTDELEEASLGLQAVVRKEKSDEPGELAVAITVLRGAYKAAQLELEAARNAALAED